MVYFTERCHDGASSISGGVPREELQVHSTEDDWRKAMLAKSRGKAPPPLHPPLTTKM